ncbi:hypothetical protein Drorol1_Dr00025044 [Drosera rotundifolia]
MNNIPEEEGWVTVCGRRDVALPNQVLVLISPSSVCWTVKKWDMNGTRILHTWFNQQNAARWMRIKLDRAMGNQAWHEEFEAAEAFFSEQDIFYHCAIVINLKKKVCLLRHPSDSFNCGVDTQISMVWLRRLGGWKLGGP